MYGVITAMFVSDETKCCNCGFAYRLHLACLRHDDFDGSCVECCELESCDGFEPVRLCSGAITPKSERIACNVDLALKDEALVSEGWVEATDDDVSWAWQHAPDSMRVKEQEAEKLIAEGRKHRGSAVRISGAVVARCGEELRQLNPQMREVNGEWILRWTRYHRDVKTEQMTWGKLIKKFFDDVMDANTEIKSLNGSLRLIDIEHAMVDPRPKGGRYYYGDQFYPCFSKIARIVRTELRKLYPWAFYAECEGGSYR